MEILKWTKEIPTTEGWYWVKWVKSDRNEAQVNLWYFDGSDYDIHQLTTRAESFYGPLTAPPDNK